MYYVFSVARDPTFCCGERACELQRFSIPSFIHADTLYYHLFLSHYSRLKPSSSPDVQRISGISPQAKYSFRSPEQRWSDSKNSKTSTLSTSPKQLATAPSWPTMMKITPIQVRILEVYALRRCESSYSRLTPTNPTSSFPSNDLCSSRTVRTNTPSK